MARISTYAIESPAEAGDRLLGSNPSNDTKNFTVGSIVDLIGISGTKDTIAMFGGGTSLVDSIITQNIFGGSEITIGGRLSVTGDLIVGNRATFSGPYARFSGQIQDSNNSSGTAGQVLSSTGTGVEWISDAGGSVTGTGIDNYFPIWTDGPNGDIGDSQLRQLGPNGSGLYQLRLENADRFIINKPSSVISGDPAFQVAQDGNPKVEFGWDDDGGGYGFLFNYAGDGWRFGSAGNNPELTIVTTSGSEGVTIANDLFINRNTTTSGDLFIESGLKDGDATYGTAGQVLSTTGVGQNVKWIDAAAGVIGTGTTNTLPIWSNGSNSGLSDSGISELRDSNGNITNIAIATNQAASPLNVDFGTGGTISFKKGTTEFIKLATSSASGFYNSSFRYGDKLTVDRDSNGQGASLDVGDASNTHAAAWFRNGVVISPNPLSVQVDNTSMVIGAGTNDVVSGSDNCLAVGNGNQILSDSDNSLAVGQGNIIRNNCDNSFAIGQANVIDGTGATTSVRSQVLGYQNSLTGSFSSFIAGGQNTVTTSQNAVALGYGHTLGGDDSMFAFGESNTGPSGVNDNNSFMIGGNLTGTDGSMALGFRNDTSSYPATDYSNGLGNTKFALAVGSTTTTNSNALLITEGGVSRGSGVAQVPRIILPQQETLEFASDTDATAGGIPTGGLYRNGNDLKINFNETAAPGNEGLTILTPHFQIATPGGSDTYTQSNNIVDFDWSGGSGTYEYILPSATAIPYRKIRFVNNSTISSNTKISITAPGTETIDGGAFYEINKAYNGCAVWSDGVQWIVIQAKA